MTDLSSYAGVRSVSFGPFVLFPAERRLEKSGIRVDIGRRPLELLIALVERAGETVSNRELFDRVWKNVIVEESSLRVNLANLRRILSDKGEDVRYIVNIPGRGYRFVAPVSRHEDGPAQAATGNAAACAYALPPKPQRIIGRDEDIRTLTMLALNYRLLSIVGPGGMGKTTVAVAVAHALPTVFDGDIFFIDLTTLASPSLLISTIAATLGLKITAADPSEGLMAWLRERNILFVLDNCEHLVDAVAGFVERLLSATPRVRVLATSREPLRSESERTYWLPPLATPPAHAAATVEDIIAYPAVRLLVERASAGRYGFAISDADAPVIAELCRKLDGIALAIELGACRIATFGLHGTVALLDNRFRLTWSGRRTAPPRHQTMGAVLDWSYDLLPEFERAVLRRLAIFVGHFPIEAACSIAGDMGAGEARIVEAIDNLVVKSMVAAEAVDACMRYRLLETTRMYALDKLCAAGERAATARRHAHYLTRHLERREGEPSSRMDADGGIGSPQVDNLGNLRACLEWSFSAGADTSVGIRLCAAAMPFLLELSLLGECERWSERALGVLASIEGEPEHEIVLREALAIATMFMRGNSPFVLTLIERGLELAVRLGNPLHELRLLAGLTLYHMRTGQLDRALQAASRNRKIAEDMGARERLAMADWMLGVIHHLLGDQLRAQQHFEAGSGEVSGIVHLKSHWFGYNQRIGSNVALARTLWLRGKADLARAMTQQVVERAQRESHPISSCIVFVYAASVFLWRGDWRDAEELIDHLAVHAAQYMLAPYQAVAKGLKGELLVKNGAPERGVALLQDAIGGLHLNRHLVQHSLHVVALADGFCRLGRHGEALSLLEDALSGAGENFNTPELLRVQGQAYAALPEPDLDRAEACLLRARACARRQQAPAWELRVATTHAALMARQGRTREASGLLAEILPLFQEGFDTADYIAASDLFNNIAEA